MSDDDASFIKKGGRETVFGYRPNFAFSANGFLTSFTLESGNTSDSKAFTNCLEENEKMTGQKAIMVSVDDGYSSAANLGYAIEKGAELVSISGSKGKNFWEKKFMRVKTTNWREISALFLKPEFQS